MISSVTWSLEHLSKLSLKYFKKENRWAHGTERYLKKQRWPLRKMFHYSFIYEKAFVPGFRRHFMGPTTEFRCIRLHVGGETDCVCVCVCGAVSVNASSINQTEVQTQNQLTFSPASASLSVSVPSPCSPLYSRFCRLFFFFFSPHRLLYRLWVQIYSRVLAGNIECMD